MRVGSRARRRFPAGRLGAFDQLRDREAGEFRKGCVVKAGQALQPAAASDDYRVDDLADLTYTTPRRQLAVIRYGAHGLASKQFADAERRLAAAAWALSLDPRLTASKHPLRRAYHARRRPEDQQFINAIKAVRPGKRPLLARQQPTGKNRWHPTYIEGDSGSDLWQSAIDTLRGNGPRHTKTAEALRKLVRAALIAQTPVFDLVIVDEAHNWINRANGADAARLAFLHRARHALLLTATPLQLQSDDLPALLGQFTDLGDWVQPRPPHALRDQLPDIEQRLATAAAAATRLRTAWSTSANGATTTGEKAEQFATGVQSARDELIRANEALEHTLHPWFIRHRRSRAHRRVLIGNEFTLVNTDHGRPPHAERNVLHEADGIESGHAQLAQLALMRVVALSQSRKQARIGEARRTTLAASLTGCYSTINESREAKHLMQTAAEAKPYRALIQPHIDTERRLLSGKHVHINNLHPKLQATLEVVEHLWRQGEKVLIYCWRVNTAKVVAAAIRQQLGVSTTDPGWTALQRRMANTPLLATTLDRIVHSLCLAGHVDAPYHVLVEQTRETALRTLAVDRSRRFRPSDIRRLHQQYQGILAKQAMTAADPIAIGLLAELIRKQPRQPPRSGTISQLPANLIGALLDEPSLLTGPVHDPAASAPRRLSQALDRYTQRFIEDAGPAAAFDRRAQLVSDLVSSIRSTRTLARLPGLRPDDTAGARHLAIAVGLPLGSGRADHDGGSILGRLSELVEEFIEIADERNLDDALQEFRASYDRPPVEEVTGKTRPAERAQLLKRFNSPLFPDVLVCTQIGGEGIDLHRYCRVVVHYDLSFNPAKLEQRNGRCDRIGSRSRRADVDLIIGVPLLAGSYDERIYATLLERDREQEALIGAGIGGEGGIGALEQDLPDDIHETPVNNRNTGPLPHDFVEQVRCDFSVWRGSTTA